MTGRTEGIVLRSRTLGEADLIIEYLTKDFGTRSAFAKSPRKIKSRFGGSLEPFTHARVALTGREDANLPRLTQSDIIRSFHPLRENTRGFIKACQFAEMVLKLMPSEGRSHDIFMLMLWGLDGLEKDPASTFVPLVFKLRILTLAGYAPALNGCTRCGNQATVFYPREGALLCGACSKEGPALGLSAALIGLHKSLSAFPLEKLSRIKPSESLLAELQKFVDLHFIEGVNVHMRSEKFY
ncbi:MAG: DNA repair protein RecO [Nitrospiraceae bacterium]|nr:DNA repair protein RecO [Nitrospiraceae bacterium]